MPRYSTSFLFPDVNVWLALSYDGHVHHPIAREWFDGLAEAARLCFCRFTQLSLLRLLTTQAVMGKAEVKTQPEAWEVYDRWLEEERVLFLDEPSALEPAFRALSRLSHPAARDWADSYLAAFATASGLTLVSFDQAFRATIKPLVLLEP